MILLTVFLAFLKLSTSFNIYPTNTNGNLDHGLTLGSYQQQLEDVQGLQHQYAPTIAYLMPMSFFDQSPSLLALSQESLHSTQALSLSHQSYDASYLDDKTLANHDASLEDREAEDESYGSAGRGVGALNLAEDDPTVASLSSGPAINSYGHSSSGRSDWVPIRNPHTHH